MFLGIMLKLKLSKRRVDDKYSKADRKIGRIWLKGASRNIVFTLARLLVEAKAARVKKSSRI